MTAAAVLDCQHREDLLLNAGTHALAAARALLDAANAGEIVETGSVMMDLLAAVKAVADADRHETGLTFDLHRIIAIVCGEAEQLYRRPG